MTHTDSLKQNSTSRAAARQVELEPASASGSVVAMATSDARYSHLLEPIRDLAQNWSIDIAGELEEYLGELESISISFEDGRTLNFAEAALLIQGSTCIYSKKVEHLYTLVYQVLNQVVEQKRQAKQAASVNAEGADADVAELNADEDAWLTLDDTLQEVDNISLPPQRGAPDTSAFTLSRAPFLGPSGESECKMHACVVHSSGALLLPNVYLPPHVLAGLSPGDRVFGAAPTPAADPLEPVGLGGGGRDDDDDDTWQPADDGDAGWADAPREEDAAPAAWTAGPAFDKAATSVEMPDVGTADADEEMAEVGRYIYTNDVYIYIHLHIYARIYIYAYMCMCIYLIYMHVCIYTHTCVCVCVCVYIYIYIYICIYI